ncbi:alpha/beta-hydrolase [Xylariomycetidae sp. FL0641]|nr:alpha/beta-hydrolase [Xylariomycetidae sp. FL0641]
MKLHCWLGIYPLLWQWRLAAAGACGPPDHLTVTASTGRYTGRANPAYPQVREFRHIAYAEAPVGARRWAAPAAVRASGRRHRTATTHRFPPPCPQYLSRAPSLWNANITDFSIPTGDQGRAAGAMAQTSAEDCLGLAVWTPLRAAAGDKLPVGLFVPGGSFRGGGLDAPHHDPAAWVQRSQKHVMVTANYRVGVMGFPNAAGLDDANLGVLDQRAALEWVYANIAAFGGDPDRITLWGHSAGGVAVDVLGFAFHDDPLAAGLFLMSGNAMRTFAQGDDALQTNFSFVAQELGCGFPDDPEAEVDCMRQVPVSLITNFVGHHGDDDKEPGLFFRPTADEKVIFENYTERAERGLMARVPALVSDTANEQSSLIEYPVDDLAAGPNKTEVDEGTLDDFICPAYNASTARAANGLTTYRYQYVGKYPNLTPYPWMGAYHGADLPMIFGTYNRSGGATDFERRVSEAMQDYVLAFLTDPENGLRDQGWLPSNGAQEGDGPMVRFGEPHIVVRNISSFEVDKACMGKGKYDSDPDS